MIKKGHVEVQDEKKRQQDKVWYIHHHAVYYPSRPGEIRVVFDCNAEWHGIHVNKSLISGLDLTS